MRLSLRAFVFGSVLSVLLIILDVAIITRVQSFGLCVDTIGAGALFCLFLLVLVVNPLLKCVGRRLALGPSELLSVYSMVLVSSTVPTWGLMCTLIGTIAGIPYLASPENQWDSVILPLIKPWLLLQDREAARWFYESAPDGTPIPYGAWLVPLLAWFVFMFLVFLASLFLGTIFRKQWVEHERLVFPLMVLPVEMVQGADGGNIPRFFRNPTTWLGFGTSGVLVALQIAHSVNPSLPYVQYLTPSHEFTLFDGAARVAVDLYFVIVGFAYLLETPVACSFWFFPLFFVVQNGLMKSRGLILTGPNEPFGGYSALSSFQGMGGMICLALAILWMARGHLRCVIRKALTGDPAVDDSQETVPYRVAGAGLIVVFLLLLAWLVGTGMPPTAAFLFLVFCFVLLLCLTRMVCQGGVGFIRAQCQPMHMVVYSLPPGMVTPQGYANLGLHFSWIAGERNNAMSSIFNSLKVMESSRVRGPAMFFALLFALVSAYVVSAYVILRMNYEHGALNSFRPWFFLSIPEFSCEFVARKISHPPTADMIAERLSAAGMGAGIVMLLMVLRSRFYWWPLHPLGFPVADSWICQQAWFSVLVAWLLKALVVKFGGLPLYRRSIPYFLGLILGQIVPVACWVLICWLAGTPNAGEIPIGLY